MVVKVRLAHSLRKEGGIKGCLPGWVKDGYRDEWRMFTGPGEMVPEPKECA